MAATTKRTSVVTELPDERHWQGRDWVKALVAAGLALSLLRPGVTPGPVAPAGPQAAATAQPVVIATAAPTLAATVAPPAAATAGLPAAVAPTILSTGTAVQAGPYEVRGSGRAGSLVELLVNGVSLGTAVVGEDGRWNLPVTLEAGPAELVARAVEEAGAVVAEAEPVRLEVGEALSGGVEGTAPTFNAPTGDVPGGPATLSGTGAPGLTVRVKAGDMVFGTAVVGADGVWQLDAILPAGRQPVVVEALGADGAAVTASEPVEINVVGGLGVIMAEPVEGAELQPGPVSVSGTGQAGAVLEILDGDKVLGEVIIGADGTWATEVPLATGASAISVREKGSDQILIRPVRVTVGSAPVAPGCGAELKVGCQAWVTRVGGLQLRIRSAPAIIADNILTRLPIGTEMTLEEGPRSAEGISWWRVTTEGGTAGWVAGENLVVQPD